MHKDIKLKGYSILATTSCCVILLGSLFAVGETAATSATTKATTTTNIVLVHGKWVDGSSWSKVIPILQKAGHKVIAVQLALHSLEDDVATVKRAISLVGGPVTLVAHSYGGFVITNAAYNNKNVTGLVYVAAHAPKEGQSNSDLVPRLILSERIFDY